MFDNSSPIKIEITLGMIQDEEVQKALGVLMTAMGKAQAKINAHFEQEMRDSPMRGPVPFPIPPRRS